MKPARSTLPFYAAIVVVVVVIALFLAKCGRNSLETATTPPLATPAPAPSNMPAAMGSRGGAAGSAAVTPLGQTAARTPAAPTEVVIQEGKTIDFSSGKAVIRDDAKEREITDLAVKEMDAASSNVTFGATTPTTVSTPSPTPAATPHD